MLFSEILRHTAVYGISSSLNRAAAFLLIPVYTRAMAPEEYGVLALCQLLVNLVAILYELGMNSALFRFYFEYDDEQSKRELLGSTVAFLLITNILFTSALYFGSSWVSGQLLDSVSHRQVVRVISVAVLVENMLNIPYVLLRANNLSTRFSILSFGNLVLSLLLNIYFVLHLKRGVLGIMESKLITASVLLCVMMPFLVKNISLRFSPSMLVQMLRFGLPLIPTNITAFLLAFSDRYILKLFVSLHEIGIYSLGYRFGAIINVVAVTAIALSWPPAIMHILKESGAQEKIAKSCTYFYGIICVLVLFLSIFADEILLAVTTDQYLRAANFVPIIAVSYMFYALYKLFESGLFIAKKTAYYPLITGVSAGLNIGLNLLLVPGHGTIAAAYNTLAAYALMSLLTLFFANRLYPLPYEYRRLLIMTAATFALIITGRSFMPETPFLSVLFKTLLFLSFPVILLLSDLLHRPVPAKLRDRSI